MRHFKVNARIREIYLCGHIYGGSYYLRFLFQKDFWLDIRDFWYNERSAFTRNLQLYVSQHLQCHLEYLVKIWNDWKLFYENSKEFMECFFQRIIGFQFLNAVKRLQNDDKKWKDFIKDYTSPNVSAIFIFNDKFKRWA